LSGPRTIFGMAVKDWRQLEAQFNELFEFANTKTIIGHEYKLFKPRYTSSIRLNFFSHCQLDLCDTTAAESIVMLCTAVNVWNSLPSTVYFSSLFAFKRTVQNVHFTASFRSS